jgi:MYXO-CTERM domain-containing protein
MDGHEGEMEARTMHVAWLGAGATVGILVLGGSGCSTAPSLEPEGALGVAAQAIQGGSTDATNTFAVGICDGFGAVNSGQCIGYCSGALILPNVVATARHCVDDTPELIDCSKNPSFGQARQGSIRVTTNTTMAGAASGWYGVAQIVRPSDAHICGNDIALLILSSSIPGSVAKPITPNVRYQMWDSSRYDGAFYGIGYGKTSPGVDDSGTRRISKPISVLCVPGADVNACPTNVVNDAEFVGGDGPCQGDSGSSAYESSSFAKGAPVSFGVLSRGGENAAGTVCENSVYTRFDAHRDFVLQAVKQASQNWTLYPEPSWTGAPIAPPGKDAGAPPGKGDGGSSGSETTGEVGLGDACETAAECASGDCSDPGDGALVCTQACDEDANVCPDGFECRAGLCFTPLPPAAAPVTTTTTTGCAAAPGGGGSSAAWAALGVVLGLGALRRRRA